MGNYICINCKYYNRDNGFCEAEDAFFMTVHAHRCAKLGEYTQLEEEGRLLSLPCKLGTPVYVIMTSILCDANTIVQKPFTIDMLPQFGKTVFTTYSAAENHHPTK